MTRPFIRKAALSFLAMLASTVMLEAEEFHPSRVLVRYRSQRSAQVVGGLNARIAHRFCNSGIAVLETRVQGSVWDGHRNAPPRPNVLTPNRIIG
jgi:hypothetical protein